MKRLIMQNYSKIKIIWLLILFCTQYLYMFHYIADTDFFLIKYFPLTGIAVFAIQFWCCKDWYKKKYLWLGGLICLSYLITIFVNYQYNLLSNCKNLYWLFLYFFLYYSYDIGQEKEEYKKGLYIFNNVIIIINLICSVLSLMFFITAFGIRIWSDQGSYVYGYLFVSGRLYGITDSVTSAVRVSVISIALSMVNCKLYDCTKKWKKLYIGNVIISIIFLVATATRAATLTFAIFLFMYIFGKHYANSREIFRRRFGQAFFRAMIVMGCWLSILFALRPVIGWVPDLGNRVFDLGEITIKESEKKREVTLEKTEVDDEVGTLRNLMNSDSIMELYGRRGTWWTVLRDNWLFGIGAANEKTYLEKYFGVADKRMSLQMHTFTNMMVFAGISGFVLYMIYIVCITAWSIKKLLQGKWNDSKEVGLIYLSLLLSLTVYTSTMYSNSFMSIFYWLFAGCTIRFIEDGKCDEN
ncbi:hypothetical protein AALA90_00335 [Lachnospiraceae bacterium 38-10]